MIKSVLSLALRFSLARMVVVSHSTFASASPDNYRQSGSQSMPAVFANHGGGPMPLLHPGEYPGMLKHLSQLGELFPNPKGLIVVSAHWQESQFTILDEDVPGLYFDYYGFPAESYKYKYDAKSTPALRQQVIDQIGKHGIILKKTPKRGYDHGVFIPLMMMYPKANIPVIQISLQKSLNPERHYMLGVALTSLRKAGYLLLGSGMSYHNMGGFGDPDQVKPSKVFDEELQSLCAKNGTHEERINAVKNWPKLKYARQCHPREEHLIPLFTCLGASDQKAGFQTKLQMLGVHVSDYVFE